MKVDVVGRILSANNPLFHLDSRAQISRFVIVGRARWKIVELKCVEIGISYIYEM